MLRDVQMALDDYSRFAAMFLAARVDRHECEGRAGALQQPRTASSLSRRCELPLGIQNLAALGVPSSTVLMSDASASTFDLSVLLNRTIVSPASTTRYKTVFVPMI